MEKGDFLEIFPPPPIQNKTYPMESAKFHQVQMT